MNEIDAHTYPYRGSVVESRGGTVVRALASCQCGLPGFSLRIEVLGGYYKITGESGHSEKNLTSSSYRLMKFRRKIPCSSRRILRSPMLNEHHGLRLIPVWCHMWVEFVVSFRLAPRVSLQVI